MTQEYYDLLLERCSPHKFFKLNWKEFSVIDFMDSFLPKVVVKQSNGLRHSDGANLFNKGLRNQEIYAFGRVNYIFNLISYPKDAIIGSSKSKVLPQPNEVVLFAEVSVEDKVALYVRMGKDISRVVSGTSRKFRSAEELEPFSTTVSEIRSYFDQKELTQEAFMEYVFGLTGTNAEGLKLLRSIFNPEEFRSPIRIGELEEEPEPCSQDFLASFESYVKGLSGTLKNLDAELQIFRSEKNMNGKLGASDTGYFGEFGFDRYDKNTHGTSDFAKKFFPVVNAIAPDYRATIVSLWAPLASITAEIPLSTGFTPVTKAKLWAKITQDASKNSAKNSGVIYFDTSTNLVKINGQTTGTIAKDGMSAPFNVGQSFSFDIECFGNLEDFVHVTFKDTDAQGKVIGILTVVPNNKTYTCNIKLVDVTYGRVASLKPNSAVHKIAKALEDFCNKNSFNQAFMNFKVLPGSETMTASNDLISGALTDDQSQSYIPRSQQSNYFNGTIDAYKELYALSQSSNKKQIIVALNTTIKNLDKFPSKDTEKRRKAVVKSATKLVKIVNERFTEDYIGQEYRLAKTFADADVQEAQKDYEEKITLYRDGLAAEAELAINKKPEFAPYKQDALDAIKRGELLEEVEEAKAKPDISNTVIVFLTPGIAAISDTTVHGSGVAGITMTGDGWVQMFNIALENTSTRDELIAHEIGHAMGLPHPFEQNKAAIDKEYDFEKQIKNYETARTAALQELIDAKKIEPKVIVPLKEFYDSKTWTYNRYLKEVKNYDDNSDFFWIDYYFSIHKVPEFVQYEIDAMKAETRTEVPEVLTRTPQSINDQFDKLIAKEKAKRDDKYAEILDFTMGQSKENFMDYGQIERKSFWYWHWIKMHCSGSPIKAHKNVK